MAIKASKIRYQWKRLHRKLDTFDYDSPDRDLNMRGIDSIVKKLLPHVSTIIGNDHGTVKEMSESTHEKIQQIKDKMQRYKKMKKHKKVPASSSNKAVNSQLSNAARDNQTGIVGSKLVSEQRRRSSSACQVPQHIEGRREKETTKEEQVFIEAAMAQRDHWLWYDPSNDFDEDMLP